MNDNSATIGNLKSIIMKFVQERNWGQFHSAKNMSMYISIEANELMELFLWTEGKEAAQQELEKRREEIEQEAADVAITLLTFCAENNIDLSKAIEAKLKLNAQRYPVEKSKDHSEKYDKL